MVGTLLAGFSVRSNLTFLAAGGLFCLIVLFLLAAAPAPSPPLSSSVCSFPPAAFLSGVIVANTKLRVALFAPAPDLQQVNKSIVIKYIN